MNKNPFFYPTKSTFGQGSPDTAPASIPIQKEISPSFLEQEQKIELPTYDDPTAIEHQTIPGLTSIIIPAFFNNYPIFHQTGNCIGSIREHTDKEKTPYEIILVINGNTGITIDPKDSLCDKVVQNEENEGYSKAVNKGIRTSFGEYIAIVNNDVQVFDHWLEDMQEALKDLSLVMATPMYGKPYARAVEANELREKGFGTPYSDFTDFSCVLTTKALFDEIGLFDEQFFMYGEDLDLLRRMTKEHKKYASTKRVNTHHIIGSTSSGVNETPEIMNESKRRLNEKWGY